MTDKTLRLVFGQWQGGHVNALLPDLDETTGSQGYYAGSRILDLLLPGSQDEVMRVPVSMRPERRLQDGVLDRDVIASQTADALKLIAISKPDRILTLGGECSVSVPPFSYLAAKYPDDVCVLWLDAHPDITLPGDAYDGYHAMAVSALLGRGDPKILSRLPAFIRPENILYVGLRDWERQEIEDREAQWGLSHLTPADFASGQGFIRLQDFMQRCRCSRVLVHFDLDVLDPADMFCAVGCVPQGLSLQLCLDIIKAAAQYKDLTALTVAELMPRRILRLVQGLQELPLIAPRNK